MADEPVMTPDELQHLVPLGLNRISMVDSFVESVPEGNLEGDKNELVEMREAITKEVKTIYDRVRNPTEDSLPSPWPPIGIPPWVCSRNFWNATRTVMKPVPVDVSEPYRDAIERTKIALEIHWHRHFDASEAAIETMREVEDYYAYIMRDFKTVKSGASIDEFLTALTKAGRHIAQLHGQLWKAIEAGVKWAEILMNRHLGYATSGAVTLFDPNELAHAVRVVCRAGNRAQFGTIIAALHAVCVSQREDGTWSCQQPFHWTGAGQTLPTLSVQTALALTSAVNEIVRNPEGFGASREEVSAGLQPVYNALNRFFRWLSSSVQSVPVPLAMIDPAAADPSRREPPLYGWCSDRVFEPGTIHSWITADAIEFLVNYRQLLQEHINELLRSKFLSHHPAELLPPLSEISPTDLRKSRTKEPVVAGRLLELLQAHKSLELAEGPWLPTKPDRPPISFYSALLYGPPGSSKTFMAKAIAGELRWPLISLSPADFLAHGEQHAEAQAEAIFTALSAGSRLVYFFDEIDELIRDRNQTTREDRNVFTFLTPSFLTKLQDLHDAAKQHEFIFLLGTNYIDHIDSAAKRSGRVDEQLPIVYPDEDSRAYITLDKLIDKLGFEQIGKGLDTLRQSKYKDERSGDIIALTAEFTGFLSYPKLQEIIDELVEIFRSTDDNRRIEQFVTYLREINEQSRRARFKPEVRLADYSGRPESIGEIEMIIPSIPGRPFPWPPDPKRESLRLKELKGLQTEIPPRLREFKERVKVLIKRAQLAEGPVETNRAAITRLIA
jgi:ATPase family associated with various cellular activities (AAA)